jgi:squalene synthase HpnC
MRRARGENFPVASLVLPRATRRHLLALYGYARLVDDTGDELQGDRLAALDWLEQDLARAYRGEARHPLMRALAPTLHACALPQETLLRLIEANRADQRVTRYATYAELRDYCHCSADPVGELVLHVFGAATAHRVALSDRVCTALQLVEHLQDVAEDLARRRVYLPGEDLARFGVAESDLARSPAPASVRALMSFEVARTRELLRAGAPLVGELRGRPRLAVAAFVGGGEAALQAIERAQFDVSAGAPHASGSRVMMMALRTLGRWRR